MIVETAVSNLNIDLVFEYIVPENLIEKIEVGKRAIVPFGKKKYSALILKIKTVSDYEIKKLKSILEVYDDKKILTDNLIDLGYWMKKYYVTSLNKVFSNMLLSETNIKSKRIITLSNDYNLENLNDLQIEIINILKNKKSCSYTYLADIFKGRNINYSINRLKNSGVICISEETNKPILKIYEQKIFILNFDISNEIKLTEKQKKIYFFIKENNGKYSPSEVSKKLNYTAGPIKSLLKKGLIEIKKIEKKHKIYSENILTNTNKIKLTKEQENSINEINKAINKNIYKTFLLFGVTGSGKTEVYMHCIDEVLKKNGTAIMLVPEISLTPQTVSRFKNRFGDKIAVMHSMLSPIERIEQWYNIINEKSKIVIGARSAVFAPLKNLQLIIVDEEHETSYKQSDNPPYNARDVAVYRGYIEKCPVILGSATPSFESYYNTEIGKYTLLKLSKRINKTVLPEIKIIDIKQENSPKNEFVFSNDLITLIEKKIKKKEQIILFLNRRGFANLTICTSCGNTFKCPACNISMPYHFKENKLLCHYCGYEISLNEKCPECNKGSLKYIGVGTEKIEIALEYYFPDITIARVDTDTIKKKNKLFEIFSDFEKNKINILIGTQILAKGLDFHNVTLVGVILADITLNIPDFRSAERTYNLLTQVAGRAGRGELDGNVIIQTFVPNHYVIKYSINQDFKKFYDYEIQLRKKYKYPPYIKLINVVFSGIFEKEVKYFSFLLKQYLKGYKLPIILSGPAPAPLSKINKLYRYHLLIKGNNLNKTKELINNFLKTNKSKKIKIFVDVDPISLM